MHDVKLGKLKVKYGYIKSDVSIFFDIGVKCLATDR